MTDFNTADLRNIQALITHGFQNGIVISQDHAKVLLVLEQKVQAQLAPVEESPEVEDGNDIPADD